METGTDHVVTAMSIKMHADIITNIDGSLRGELQSIYFKKPFKFTSLVRMIEKMEKTFDTKGFPEKYMLPRSFSDAKPVRHRRGTDLIETVKEAEIPTMQMTPGDTRCTFEISVRYRENAEWQGRITWLEENRTLEFKSVLEMLKLINDATENKFH